MPNGPHGHPHYALRIPELTQDARQEVCLPAWRFCRSVLKVVGKNIIVDNRRLI